VTARNVAREWVLDRLAAGDLAALPEHYAADVLLDVNRPAWRVQLRGRAAAAEFFAEEGQDRVNVRTAWIRTTATDAAIVAEYEQRWDGPDGERLTRTVSVLRMADDEIIEHADYGCGIWTPEAIAKNRAEAPIIEW
jgi:predicted SnoaL-like aldol condensation-catalyzing enzyme